MHVAKELQSHDNMGVVSTNNEGVAQTTDKIPAGLQSHLSMGVISTCGINTQPLTQSSRQSSCNPIHIWEHAC